MPISIIIPTKDRPVGLQRAVASARAALPPGGEIVVVDDGSTTAARHVLSGHVGLRVVLNGGPRFGPSAARNFGVGVAQHPLVLFLDDDDELLPSYLARIVEVARQEPDIVFGTGRRANAGRMQTVRRPGRHDASSPLRFRLYGAGGLWVRKAAFCQIGGFCESLLVGEDIEFCIRLAKARAAMWFDPVPSYKTGNASGGGVPTSAPFNNASTQRQGRGAMNCCWSGMATSCGATLDDVGGSTVCGWQNCVSKQF